LTKTRKYVKTVELDIATDMKASKANNAVIIVAT
jgi:hypothetical protein